MGLGFSGGWCAALVVALGAMGSADAAILVLTSGLTAEGQVVSQDGREVVFHAEGAEHEVHLPLMLIRRLVETDEHGAAKPATTRANPAWEIPTEPDAPPLAPAPSGPTYYLIPLHGEVGATVLASTLEKSLADAERRKPTVVVLDIDSPGGLVDEAKKIAKVLHRYNKKLRIVALADQDLSAAAILTLSVKEIYLKSSGIIGAATSFRSLDIALPPKLEEKMQSAWRAVARNSAEEGGHEPLLAEAMIDNDLELHLEKTNGKPEVREGPGEKTLCRKGKVLTLTSHEAIECGLASGEADDLDELSKELKLDGWTECKGLGALLADYLPKRNERFQAVSNRVLAEFRQNCVRAQQSAPSAEVSRVLVGGGPQRYVKTGNRLRAVPGRPPTVVTNVSHARWNEMSLQCVLALQQAEENLSDEVALCKAFGQEGLADLIGQIGIEIAATRARIYDDRNKYGIPGQPPRVGPATQPAARSPETNPSK